MSKNHADQVFGVDWIIIVAAIVAAAIFGGCNERDKRPAGGLFRPGLIFQGDRSYRPEEWANRQRSPVRYDPPRTFWR